MLTIYGIKNCATMKKAFAWCEEQGLEYVFHDYKKQGVPRDRLLSWCQQLGWKSLVNTRGTTWRKLTVGQQEIATEGQAIALMLEYPSLIKRPVVEVTSMRGTQFLIGFDPQLCSSLLKAAEQ